MGHICVLVNHTLGQGGCSSFPLEARVTDIPLPGVHTVILDPDVCMLNRYGGWTCGARTSRRSPVSFLNAVFNAEANSFESTLPLRAHTCLQPRSLVCPGC